MQQEAKSQPISITARRASRQDAATTEQQPMSAERKAAYRHFALVVLGLDVPTLTNDLRARRLQRTAPLRLVGQSDRAA